VNLHYCPHLNTSVELSDERVQHIANRHPELLPEYLTLLSEVLRAPDNVRPSSRLINALLFSKYYADIMGGKHLVVVVVNEPAAKRSWIVTAYFTRRLV